MFAHCRAVWRVDDFSRCFQKDYLETLFPLIACGLSFLYLVSQLVRAAARSKYALAYSLLDKPPHVWSLSIPPPGQEYGASSEDEDEFERNEYLALHPTTSRTIESIVKVDRPRGQSLIVVVEELAVLAEFGIHLAVLINQGWGPTGLIAAAAGVATWGYISVIVSVRLLLSSSSRFSFPRLWYHSACLYGIEWVLTTLVFRSAIIHPPSRTAQAFTISDFVLVTVLTLIALLSRKGNKAVELEYEGDMEPSKEQTASVLSLATFSWVDAIVWHGYRKTYELADVWNLPPKDKAEAILADYRQLKKRSALAWHLLKYFRGRLLRQAAWACFSGVLTFMPTLLLKAILEYVEDPRDTPRSAAWFWVILLFVSSCASALSDGQGLWLGRRVCIRSRAIIVGEVYAKALKRKAATLENKVLGEKPGQNPKHGLKKKMMSFGRKKKTQDAQKDEAQSKPGSDSQVSSGTIINLMAVDSFKVSEISAYLHFLWANAPVQIIMAIVLLYRMLGYSSIAGLLMMVLLLPLNLFLSKQFAAIQKKILAATDKRIHMTNEVLTNIRIIKYFAWEQRFMHAVDETRTAELRQLRKRYIVWALAATLWSVAPILITFLSFFVYTVVEKKRLIPSVAFPALSLFQLLRIPLDQIADMIAHVQESKVSVDRIEEFLNEEDTDKYKQLRYEELDDGSDPIIGFEEATFTWGSQRSHDVDATSAFRMIGLNVKFQVSQLNLVVGPTGSGKTSLLMALLGEMTKLEGEVYLPGARSRDDVKPDPDTGLTETVAYCAQQAWLVNTTIKENILFASPWDPTRYKSVLRACSLNKDLEILDAGDETLVGEKGVTLSGGQKQRISLARALYSHARHVLLDDVLSAVDSHTAKWIFEHAIMGPLMYHRTCILVSHNVALCLPASQFAVVLDNGKIVAQGSPNEVIDSGRLGDDLSKSRPASQVPSRIPSQAPSDTESMGTTALKQGSVGLNGQANGSANGDLHLTESAKADDAAKPAKSPPAEAKATGGVKLTVILMYLRNMGPWYFWLATAVAFVAQQVSSVTNNLWIRQWANSYVTKDVDALDTTHSLYPMPKASMSSWVRSGTCFGNVPFMSNSYSGVYRQFSASDVDSGYYLGIYALLGVVYMLITFLREGILFGGSLAASRKIHRQLMESITHAKFRFFDSTPLGQITNRFSKDIEAVDQEVAPVAVGVIYCLASIITIVILISAITPGFLIAGFFISILYFLIGNFYLNSSRDLKRLESVQRSPLYQQFGETLSGMVTIRAYGDERRFMRENLHRVNTHNRPFMYLWAANRWLAFRVDVTGALVSFFSGAFVVLSASTIDAGAAGLALTYAVTFTENVLWFVRLYASNEQNMNSVERIKEYLDVEQEAKSIIPENRPPGNWPSRGEIEFINYSTRYRPDFDFVLKNITFRILPGEKVGVVGRTGAGKSSLALALFRALEAVEGKILVDDIDIGLIGLQDLRENIVMVPQDPTLFTGTIRSNLDPFNLFTDEEIFTTLRSVHLIGPAMPTASATPSRPSTPTSPSTPISATSPSDANATTAPPVENKNLFRKLSSAVAESGSNLSQGQRQLLCLARALLKSPRVLLMDEATASIDYATDAKIQETIRELKDTTIITIAHRLQTIVDYDKVIVLEKGRVVEFGSPWELMSRDGAGVEGGGGGGGEGLSAKGWFRGMCEVSGEFEVLRSEAKKAWQKKRLVDDG